MIATVQGEQVVARWDTLRDPVKVRHAVSQGAERAEPGPERYRGRGWRVTVSRIRDAHHEVSHRRRPGRSASRREEQRRVDGGVRVACGDAHGEGRRRWASRCGGDVGATNTVAPLPSHRAELVAMLIAPVGAVASGCDVQPAASVTSSRGASRRTCVPSSGRPCDTPYARAARGAIPSGRRRPHPGVDDRRRPRSSMRQRAVERPRRATASITTAARSTSAVIICS